MVREDRRSGIAFPGFDLGFQKLRRSISSEAIKAGLPAELGGHVAQGHALLHRQRADRGAAVLDRLVLPAVEAEAADEEQHHVLGRHAGLERAVEIHAMVCGTLSQISPVTSTPSISVAPTPNM